MTVAFLRGIKHGALGARQRELRSQIFRGVLAPGQAGEPPPPSHRKLRMMQHLPWGEVEPDEDTHQTP